MEETIEKIKAIERDVNRHQIAVLDGRAKGELNRALRYLADARAILRVVNATTPRTDSTKDH